MSHFYGTIEGSAKTTATRAGSKLSGLVTFCASYAGAIKSTAFVNSAGIDWVHVEKIPWRGSGENRILYDGPLGESPQDAPPAPPEPVPMAKHLDTPRDRTQSTSGPLTAIQ